MSSAVPARPDRGTLATGAALLFLSVAAWVATWRNATAMDMGPPDGSLLAQATTYTLMWGVMMAAMMLPSAAPMILLYRTVSQRLRGPGERALPPLLFAALYLAAWTLSGLPVFAATVAVARATAESAALRSAVPFALAATIAAAGLYQFTPLKSACLKQCETPLSFLMERWRSGYAATTGLALRHAAYCLGCCWGLMVILVAAGAMSLPWVLAISLLVFAEKVLPGGQRTARVIGALLLVLATAVALRPELATTLRFAPSMGAETEAPAGPGEMEGMEGMEGM